MEYIWYIVITAAAVILIAYILLGSERERKERYKRGFRQLWGQQPEREYTGEEFNSIRRYFSNHSKEGFYIDDITWNDLDMDSVYMMMNITQSSIGDEFLYYLLRMPSFDQEELDERERIIQYLSHNQQIREDLQFIFQDIGRTNRISISDYVYRLHELKTENRRFHIICALLVPAAILTVFINPTICVLLTIAAIFHNGIQYFKRKHQLEPYVDTIRYIIRMLSTLKKFEKMEGEAIQKYLNNITKKRMEFKKFMRNSFLVTTGKTAGGNPVEIMMDYIRMIFHADFIKFYSMLNEIKLHIQDVEEIFKNIGILESVIAIASFRVMMPLYCKPELSASQDAFLKIENMYHPLVEEPVANSISVDGSVLLTGSNASGKSTFLKTAAINAILAQSINTCLAEKYNANFYRIYSSMALKDDLANKESYYIVEIKSLKRILDSRKEPGCLLCFVDEVLRGTNTVERIAASSQILKSFVSDDIMCFAATHDIELTHILEDYYKNYHFEERIVDNDIYFNYQLYKGRAVTRNAIKLLSIIGYDDKIINNAEASAARFIEDGVWSL